MVDVGVQNEQIIYRCTLTLEGTAIQDAAGTSATQESGHARSELQEDY